MNKLEALSAFHNAFGIKKPNKMDTQEYSDFLALRTSLLKEEYEEGRDAMVSIQATLSEGMSPTLEQKAELFDAYVDMLYLIYGTADLLDVDIDAMFAEVHASNMSKLDENGNPIINGENGVLDETRPLGKVLKSDKFREPELKQFVIDKIEQTELDI